MTRDEMEQIVSEFLGRKPTEQEMSDFQFVLIENNMRVDAFLESAEENELTVSIQQDGAIFVNVQFLIDLIPLLAEPDEDGLIDDTRLAIGVTMRNLVAAAGRNVGVDIV